MSMKSTGFAKAARLARRVSQASRDSGSRRGFLGGWSGPQVGSEMQAENERVLIQRRAADLAANDWIAESLLSAMQYNVVGEGLRPSCRIPADMLGIGKQEAAKLGKRFEWMFARWSVRASLCGTMSFGELQRMALRTMLILGEAVHMPVMLSEKERLARNVPYSFAVQPLAPQRLRTPSGMSSDAAVRDGIRFSEYGQPVAYYVAQPKADSGSMLTDFDNVAEYITVPASIGHRRGLYHLFVRKDDEQVRGESVFANSASLFQYVDKAIQYELEAQHLAAKWAVFIAKEYEVTPPGVTTQVNEEGQPERIIDIDGPEVIIGEPGEEPKMLKSDRPSANWKELIKLALGGVGGSAALTSLAITRDHSDVNYSSARAANNSDWRVYMWYRSFLGANYCQHVFSSVIEEAYLRGEWAPPAGAPGFYEARDLWTSCVWVGPARGYMDPTKEIQADVMAIDNHLVTRRDVHLANGRDWDDDLDVLLAEREAMRALTGNKADASSASSTGGAASSSAPGESSGGPATTTNSDDEGDDEE